MTLDGLLMLTEKDEYIYHEMITHIPMATNPNIRNRFWSLEQGTAERFGNSVRYPSIEHIDVAEIDETGGANCRRNICRLLPADLDDPRVDVHISGWAAVCPESRKRI